MFPNSWPGTGLLLLRVAGGLPLLVGGGLRWAGAPNSLAMPCKALGIGVGGLLLAGLWTPFAGALQAVLSLSPALFNARLSADYAVMASLGLGLAMLGPGAWSVDARLYGRKRIEIRTDR